jgi:hypothetical protein
LKITNGVVSTTVCFQQEPSGTQAPFLSAFGDDPTLHAWIGAEEAKFLNKKVPVSTPGHSPNSQRTR